MELEAVIGLSAFNLVDPQYQDLARQNVDRVFATGETMQYEVLGGKMPDGEAFWYETWLGPLILDGEIKFVTLISSDNTERKRAEDLLQKTQ